MTGSEIPGFTAAADDPLAGHCAVIAALVIALEDRGFLAKNSYRDALERLWVGMADDVAEGEPGAVIERVLDFLDRRTGARSGAADPDEGRKVLPLAGRRA